MPVKQKLLIFVGAVIGLGLTATFAVAQWAEPTQSPPQGNTKGVIWNSSDAAQDGSFNILGTGNAGILEAGSPAGTKGNTKIGGDSVRPGIYFDKTNGGYDAKPNVYRFLGTGTAGEQNSIIIRNEVAGADLMLSGGPSDGRVYVKDSKLCLGGRGDADCIANWSQIDIDESQFVHLFDDPGADPNDNGHILLNGTIVATGDGANSASEGRIKIGDNASGTVHRPGLWFKPEGEAYDTTPNIYRYTGSSGESNNGIVIRNEKADAHIFLGPTGTGKTEFSSQVRIGNQSSGSVNRPGIWFKNKAGNFDGSLPNIYRYAGSHSTPGAQDSLVIRNEVAGADIALDTAGGGLIEFKDPVRAPLVVNGKTVSTLSTVAEFGNEHAGVGLAGGYFQAKQNTTSINQSYLGHVSDVFVAAGLFADTASQNSAIIGSPVYAAHFHGPVLINRLLKLGYNSGGAAETNQPVVETPEDLFLVLAKRGAGTKSGDFRIYDNSISNGTELFHLDGEGNLKIKGSLNEFGTGGGGPSSPIFATVSIEGLGGASDPDVNTPPGSDGQPKLYLGKTNSPAADETLYLRNASYPSHKANLFVEGDFTVEGTTTGGTHTPGFFVATGTGNTTIKGTATINGNTTMRGATSVITNSGIPFLIQTNAGSDILRINTVFAETTLSQSLKVNSSITASGHIYAHSTTHIGDIAEPLAIFKTAQPGDVVIVSGDQYKPSERAYDKRVIGVYSENPSLILANIEKRKPLAVSGFVKVNATAENGSIQAGDLLVSSSTLGSAMRCEGAEKCFGAVIGKALEPLANGKGKILMIVALQ